MFGLNIARERAGHLKVIDGTPPEREAEVMPGMLPGTHLATATGWRPVEGLTKGDRVLTFDSGMQVVTDVTTTPIWTGPGRCPQDFWPLQVPSGMLGNPQAMALMPGQGVMIESDVAEAIYGDPFAVVPARVLSDMERVDRLVPDEGLQVIRLRFADEQIVFGRGGMMFLCQSSRDILEQAGRVSAYDMLSVTEARDLLEQGGPGCIQMGPEPAMAGQG